MLKERTIKLREASHEPEGWPDEHSFVAFEHPAYANLTTASDVIEGILSFSGFDAMSHPYTEAEPKTPPPKRRKTKIAKTLV